MGGSLAAATASGARAATICATRGEVGEISDPSLATPETLGAVREAELRAACAAVGVTDVRFLGYRDSGMDGTAENRDPRAFVNASDEEVTERIAGLLRELRADVVVTFEPGGVYGHPDHKKISRCATAAFDRVPGRRLFHSGPRRSQFDELRAELLAAGVPPSPLWEQVEQFGMADDQVTTTVDVSAQLARKKAALRMHATQMNPWLRQLPERLFDKLLSRESFGLVRGELTAGARRSLLEGLEP